MRVLCSHVSNKLSAVWVALFTIPVSIFFKLMLASKSGRKLFYKSYPPDQLLVANVGKEKYLINSSDVVIGLYVFQEKQAFESDRLYQVCNLLSKQRRHKKILLDIGANIGTVGIHAIVNKLFDQCIAFEPEPNNFRMLCANIALNGVQDQFVTHNLAISDNTIKQLPFELSHDNFGDHRVRMSNEKGLFNEQQRSVINVSAQPLDDFFNQVNQDVCIIWMDTQGFEGHILTGATSFLEKGVPIVTEFWPYGLKRAHCLEKFLTAVENGNYSTIIDLREPSSHLICNRRNLISLAESLGYKGQFTDLLIM